MARFLRALTLLVFAATFPAAAIAVDTSNGGDLHMEECTRCHDSSVYTRADRKVPDLPRLGTQVRFCKDNLGVAWFDDEVEDVIGYLNQAYYHF